MAAKLHESFAIHPGPWLRDQVIKSYGMTVTSAADHRKVTRSVLSRILNDNARLASMMAIRFEKAFGISAATLLRMQLLHDLTTAKLKASSSMSVSRVPPPTELRRVWNLLSAH
ncbi:MAG: addiction module antidote protein, HigA family [Citromicrobium sp.]|nr:addiction module antidote protein, HigA family [Citromicrobium sp.]